jgi:hypothetical protein
MRDLALNFKRITLILSFLITCTRDALEPANIRCSRSDFELIRIENILLVILTNSSFYKEWFFIQNEK